MKYMVAERKISNKNKKIIMREIEKQHTDENEDLRSGGKHIYNGVNYRDV